MSKDFRNVHDMREKERQSKVTMDYPVRELPKEIIYKWAWGDEERVDLTGEWCPLVKDKQSVLKECKVDKLVNCGPRGYAKHWKECPIYRASEEASP